VIAMATVTKQLDGASTGFDGDTVLVMTDGSIYRQTQYYYAYRYQYRPKVTVITTAKSSCPEFPNR
jgi:hypothetical protein